MTKNLMSDLEDLIPSKPIEPKPDLKPVTEDTVHPRDAQWQRFRPLFADAIEGSRYTIHDVDRQVGQGQMMFFPGKNAAVIAVKTTFPDQTSDLQTLWAVGDLSEIVELEPGICAMARLLGCVGILVEGRKGWERVLKHRGYTHWSTTVRKDL